MMFSLAVVLGYGLFRGVNANAYLSAFASVEAPFLFVPDLFFNVVVACAVVACSVTVIALAVRGRLKPLSMPFLLPTGLLIVGNVRALIGAFSVLPSDMALLVPGVLFGVASTMLSLVWIEVLACQEPKAIVTYIALGMLVNMVTSSGLSGLTGAGQMAASIVLLGIMACCAAYVRRTLRATGATKRWLPVDAGSRSVQGSTERASYRDAFLELGDALVAFCVLEAVIGLLNSFMLGSSVQFAGSGTVSAAGTLIGIFAFCVVVFVVQRIPRVSTVFRVLMPAIASLLVFLPFLGETYNLFFSTVLLGGYYFIALLLTYVVAEVARERRISPYVLMAAASGAARVCLAVALLGGQAAGSLPGGLFGESEHTMRFLVIIMAVIYVLSLAVVLISRDRRRRRDAEDAQAVESAPREALPVDASGGEALLERRCALLAARGDLTEREAEILGYLARGRTKAHIAGVLFVSENTVRSHVRNIYSKLGVHTRQQLIDALEAEE